MRKVFTTALMCAAGFSAFAQTPVQENNKQSERLFKEVLLEQSNFNPKVSRKADEEINEYFRFSDDLSALEGGFGDNFFFTMFPDSTVSNVLYDSDDNKAVVSSPLWMGVGSCFDPNDDIWSSPLPLSNSWENYEIDSLLLTYGYFRKTDPTDNIVDTLVVTVFYDLNTTPGGQLFPTTWQTGGGAVAMPSIDRNAENFSRNYTETFKIPLDDMDSTVTSDAGTFRPKTMRIDIKDRIVNVGTGRAMAVTFNYLPGTEWAEGDTLIFSDQVRDLGVAEPVKKHNQFGILVAVQTPNYTHLDSYNNGLFISRTHKYSGNNYWQPNLFGTSTTTYGYYPYIAYKVKATISGVEELSADNNSLSSVYPNPASMGDELNLNFSVNSTEKVTINVYDLTGKKISTLVDATYNKGVHKVSFSSDDFKSGLYIYTMTAGSYTTSSKFSITK